MNVRNTCYFVAAFTYFKSFVLVLSVQLSMHHDHAQDGGDLLARLVVCAPNELMNLWSVRLLWAVWFALVIYREPPEVIEIGTCVGTRESLQALPWFNGPTRQC